LAGLSLFPSAVRPLAILETAANRLNPDSAVEREVMSKEQTFRSEDMPFGIANGKSQILKIWNL
jgi:hypothetical protein